VSQEAISAATARYAADCGRFGKQVFPTTGEIIILNGLKVVALFRNDRLAIAYRLVDGAVDDLDGVDLARVRRLLTRRKAHHE
jgi:hypothetical protein